jgi:hypothetical protein
MRKAVLSCLCVVLLSVSLLAQQTVQIMPLTRGGQVLVSFRLTNAFTDEVLAAIHSGMTITFVYDVELKRASSLWLDRTIASTSVTAAVRYDNLTRKYHVKRTEDGRIERAETLDREDLAREWLTDFDKLPLFSSAALERNAEYYLRVRAHTTPRNASFVWPWGHSDVSGQRKFTFIQ